MTRDARVTAEAVARASYGRLLAFTARRTRDVASAEDALSGAFLAALETWPRTGVPDNPDAWLLTSARRKLIDAARHAQTVEAAQPELLWLAELDARDPTEPTLIPDERLHMLFLCTHPAIASDARTPLMLQAVLGLDAARIASAFLVAPSTMGQRLVRAKRRIKEVRIPFDLPDAARLPERLDAVLEAIYAAYGTAWEDPAGSDPRSGDLSAEALFLARLLASLLPDEAEALGLLALLCHCQARRDARRDAQGLYVPLTEQDPRRWSRELVFEAQAALEQAAACVAQGAAVGHFQLEAAIQSVHAQRAQTGATNWLAITQLYEGLVRLSPTLGARVARASARGEAFGAEAGLAALAEIDEMTARSYQPFFAVRAHLHAHAGRDAEARADYQRALGLCEDAAVRDFLAHRLSAL